MGYGILFSGKKRVLLANHNDLIDVETVRRVLRVNQINKADDIDGGGDIYNDNDRTQIIQLLCKRLIRV